MGAIETEELQGILAEMKTVYAAQSEALVRASAELAAQMKRWADEKQNGSLVTVEGITSAFEANSSRLEACCTNLEAAAKTLEMPGKNLPVFSGKNKNILNALNKMAVKFAELQKTLLSHTNAAETAAIKKLDGISAALETEVTKTWNSINETLTRNAKELSASYEHFFELCKTLSAMNKGSAEW